MNPVKLNEVQISEIHKLAQEKRRSLGFVEIGRASCRERV